MTVPNVLGPIKSVHEFLSASNSLLTDYSALRLYRGQTDDWPLAPKLLRAPLTPADLRKTEKLLLDNFKSQCLHLLPSSPYLYHDIMSLGQHHGLPTRMLDWSSSPLMALFFAVEGVRPPPCPLVWIFDATAAQCSEGDAIKECGYIEPEATAVLSPSSHSQRVVAQAGVHTIHTLKGTATSSRRVLPMDETDDAKQLTKITIDSQFGKQIKGELKLWGIHAATVYGDLGSVCRELQDDLDIPFSMRSDAPFHIKRQHESAIETVASLLANGLPLKAGQGFVQLGTLRAKGQKKPNWSAALGSVLTEELLAEAISRLESTYGKAHSFRPLLELAQTGVNRRKR